MSNEEKSSVTENFDNETNSHDYEESKLLKDVPEKEFLEAFVKKNRIALNGLKDEVHERLSDLFRGYNKHVIDVTDKSTRYIMNTLPEVVTKQCTKEFSDAASVVKNDLQDFNNHFCTNKLIVDLVGIEKRNRITTYCVWATLILFIGVVWFLASHSLANKEAYIQKSLEPYVQMKDQFFYIVNAMDNNLRSHSHEFVHDFLPQGKQEGDWWEAKFPFTPGEKEHRIKVNLVNNHWIDEDTHVGTHGLVPLYAYLMNKGYFDACVDMKARFGSDK